MKKRKEIILDTALDLFNKNGLAKVTLRTIANEMGISQGNLTYHFIKRNEIIETLYFQLVQKIDDKMNGNEEMSIDLSAIFGLSATIMESFYEYRFFLLDFVQIMRDNQVVKEHYLQLSKKREEQFLVLFSVLEQKNILRKEALPNEYLFLYKRLQILGDFWISSAAVTNARLSKKIIKEYSDIINQSVFPYLTEIGKEEYFRNIK